MNRDDANKALEAQALQVIMIVADALQELGRVPSGEFYVRVMGYMNISTYNRIIGTLKGAGLVEEKNNQLIWIGPAKEAGKK